MRRFAACMLVAFVAACLPAKMAGAISAEISGYVEGTYNLNLNDPPPEPTPDTLLHLYDADVNTFLLNMAHVSIAGSLSEEADYVVEIDLGADAMINSSRSQVLGGFPYYADLQEAYLVAKSTHSKVGLKAGKFATYQGIEKIEAPENPTISRGLLFTYAQPLTHTGAVVTYSQDEISAALGLVNGWDIVTDDNDDQTLLANVEMTADVGMGYVRNLGLKATYMQGNEEYAGGTYERSSIDVTATAKLEHNVTVYVQYNEGTQENAPGVGDDDWRGYGAQLVYEPTAEVSMGFRYESFADENDVRVNLGPPAGDGNYWNVTFSLGFRLAGSTMLRFEIRRDEADWDAFTDEDGLATDSQTTMGVEFYCTF